MKLYTKWHGNIPILTEEPAQHSARFTPVFYEEAERFLYPGLQPRKYDYTVYLWAQHYTYYYAGQRVCKWNCGDLTMCCGDGQTSTANANGFDLSRLAEYSIDPEELLALNAAVMERLEEDAMLSISHVADEHPDLPIEIGYSGGKDSEVLWHLFRRTLPDERYKVVFNDTRQEFRNTYQRVADLNFAGAGIEIIDPGIDPVELWRKIGPPSRHNRYCCRVYKHNEPGAKISACGVRASESAQRSKYEKTTMGAKYVGVLQFYPMLDWPDLAVWLYIIGKGIAVNELYRHGLRRVGCVCCPCASENIEHRIDVIDPYARRSFLQAIEDSVFPGCNWKTSFGDSRRMPQPFEVERSAKGNRYTWAADKQLHHDWYKPLENPLPVEQGQTEAILPASGETGRFAAMERSIACICCGTCAHECLTGALQIDWKRQTVRVDEQRCCHCKACLKKQCIVVKNLKKRLTLEDLLDSED